MMNTSPLTAAVFTPTYDTSRSAKSLEGEAEWEEKFDSVDGPGVSARALEGEAEWEENIIETDGRSIDLYA